MINKLLRQFDTTMGSLGSLQSVQTANKPDLTEVIVRLRALKSQFGECMEINGRTQAKESIFYAMPRYDSERGAFV